MAKQAKKNDTTKELKNKIEELEEELKRSIADYQNFEKRMEEEKKETIKYANRELLLHLLPALDTLFLAGKHTEDEGVKLTVKNVYDVLESIGVKKIETEGKDFDAKTMDCVETVNGEDGKVSSEVKPGFMLHDKLLQPAVVKVGSSN